MATYSKPTEVPFWADDGVNNTPIPLAKKNLGWVFGEPPPSGMENYRANLVGEWIKWFDERWSDGSSSNIVVMNNPQTPGESIFEFRRNNIGLHFQTANGPIDVVDYWDTDNGTREIELNGSSHFKLDSSDDSMTMGEGTNSIRAIGKGNDKQFVFGGSDFNRIVWDDVLKEFNVFANQAVSTFRIKNNEVRAFQNLVSSLDVKAEQGLTVGSVASNPGAGQAIVSSGLRVGSDGLPSVGQLEVGDANFSMLLSGANATLNFSEFSALAYNRTGNRFQFSVNNDDILSIESTGIFPGEPTTVFIGSAVSPWNRAYINRVFFDEAVENPGNRRTLTQNNTPTLVATVIGNDKDGNNNFNFNSLTHNSTGVYTIDVGDPLTVDSAIIATINDDVAVTTRKFLKAYWDNLNSWVRIYVTDDAGSPVNADFSLIAFG